MGQAKLRAKEIEQLKNTVGKQYPILAIRHCEDGSKEFAYFAANYKKPTVPKDQLLPYICLKDWVHNAPTAAIAEYLWQTNAFNMLESFQGAEAFEINFYEVDAERSAIKGQKVYSCRMIVGGTKSSVNERAIELKDTLSKTGEYSIKTGEEVIF